MSGKGGLGNPQTAKALGRKALWIILPPRSVEKRGIATSRQIRFAPPFFVPKP
jgi:hypothetical protein